MRAPLLAPGVEPELAPLPRRPRWRRARGWLWTHLVAGALVSVPLVAWVARSAFDLAFAALGTADTARIVSSSAKAGQYTLTVEYTRLEWDGRPRTERAVLPVDGIELSRLARQPSMPVTRLGRGAWQKIDLETHRERNGWASAAYLALWVLPLAGGALFFIWGRLAREWWLVRWGRPVRGRVRGRARWGFTQRRYALHYEYAEGDGTGRGATLYGRARVSKGEHDAYEAGAPLTVLHALWNPRVSVAYPFCRFGAVSPPARPARAAGPGAPGSR